MRLANALRTLTVIAWLSLSLNWVVPAFETDQYHLPPQPLADIGDEVSEYVESALAEAIAAVNSEIAEVEQCRLSPKRRGCRGPEENQKRLAFLLSEHSIPKAFFDLTAGDSLMTTRFGKWLASHKFRDQPDRFKPAYRDSIFILNPANHLTMTPTVRLYGHEFGVDKLEHLFQQGHQYYEVRQKALEAGKTPAEAERATLEWGKRTERTYYGLLTSGVYSNADLAANFAGLRFYESLTKPVKVGDLDRPAAAALKNGRWSAVDRVLTAELLLKPFLSDHLNEALNPSSFRLTLYPSVRRAVRKSACDDWNKAFPTLTRSHLKAASARLEEWHGEDYGFTRRGRVVDVGDVCFGDKAGA